MTLLSTLNSPADLRALPAAQLAALAAELRSFLIDTVGNTGGHLGSNLGIVELTLALHRVYDFSYDRLLFDVGHQSYVHKILTGRREKFATLRQKNGLSGFPNPAESNFDLFTAGHASTSISLAAGLAAAAQLHRDDQRRTVAVIGDGAISGGISFEALNHIGHAGWNVLVVLNDNEMAISKTVGALARALDEFRSRPQATQWRRAIKKFLGDVPLVGGGLTWLQEKFLRALKNHHGAAEVFEAMGFRYFGPFDGHDLPTLTQELRNLKQLSGALLLHVITEKGRGFADAIADPEKFHSTNPLPRLNTEKSGGKITLHLAKTPSYTDVFADTLCAVATENPRVVAITAAMVSGIGMQKFAAQFPSRFFDVGIAESHAISFAAGLAKAGFIPVVGIYSTFLQRGYDQVFHELALQKNLPVVLAIDRAGVVGSDGPTHHGVFDIAYLRHLPHLILMSPSDGAELAAMLRYALTCGKTVAIRYPRGSVPRINTASPRAEIVLGKSEKLHDGTDGALIAYGRLVAPALAAAQKMAANNENRQNFAVYNARFAKPLDAEMLLQAAQTGLIITLEDHALAGGFGSAVAEFIADHHLTCRVARLGIGDEFVEAATIAELDAQLGFDLDGIIKFVNEVAS